MSVREHSRSCKDNAQKILAAPVKEKRNLKELKAAKERQIAEEILSSLEKRRYPKPPSSNAVPARKKENRNKRTDPRKDFTPSKEGKLYYKFNQIKRNDKNPKSRKRQSNEPVLSLNAGDKIQPGNKKFEFQGVFLQRNLAYLRAFENLNKSEELRHLLPESTTEIVKKTATQEFCVELNHFKVTKKKPAGNLFVDYDTNIAVYMLSSSGLDGTLEPSRTLLEEFCIPSNGVNLVAKNAASKLKTVRPQMTSKFSLSKVKSERAKTQILLEFRIFLKPAENTIGDHGSFSVDTKLVPIVQNGCLMVSSRDFMTIPLRRNYESGPELIASLSYVLSVKPKQQNRYLEFCRERRAMRHLGQAFKGSDYEGSLREKHDKFMNKQLTSEDFLSSDEEPNEGQFDEYVDQLTAKLSKLIPSENNNLRSQKSQKKGIYDVCSEIYDRKLIKSKNKTPDYLIPVFDPCCEIHDRTKFGIYGICTKCKNYIDKNWNVDDTRTKRNDNIFEIFDEASNSNDVQIIEPMEVTLGNDSNASDTTVVKNEINIANDQPKKGADDLEQKANLKESNVVKKPKKVNGILTINKGFYFSNALPLEVHFICGIRGSLKRTTKSPVCLFCDSIFNCYELLLLHLIFSHRRIRVTHFPSNFGSVLEIRKTKKKQVENNGDQENKENEGNAKKAAKSNQSKGSKKGKGTMTVKQENATEAEKDADTKETSENDQKQGQTGKREEDEDSRCYLFTANKAFEINEDLLYRKVYLSKDEYGNESESTMARISGRAEVALKRNAIGIMAINQVSYMTDKNGEKRFTRMLGDSATPVGFFHSSHCLRRQFCSQAYCSDVDEEEFAWMDEAEQRVLDEYIDLAAGEKRFMVLWNAFFCNVKLGPGDCKVMMTIEAFLETHKDILAREDLLGHMKAHVEMMRSYGILSDSFALRMMQKTSMLEHSVRI